jgi:hypothetical protein
MITYTITLTEAESDAISYIAENPQEWVENAMKNRARIAMDEIVQLCVTACLENNVTIPGTKEEIITLAFDQSWVKTAAERNKELEANKPPAE